MATDHLRMESKRIRMVEETALAEETVWVMAWVMVWVMVLATV